MQIRIHVRRGTAILAERCTAARQNDTSHALNSLCQGEDTTQERLPYASHLLLAAYAYACL